MSVLASSAEPEEVNPVSVQIHTLDARLSGNQKSEKFVMDIYIDSDTKRRDRIPFSPEGRLATWKTEPPHSLRDGSSATVKILRKKVFGREPDIVKTVPLSFAEAQNRVTAAVSPMPIDYVLYEGGGVRVCAMMSMTKPDVLLGVARDLADGLQSPLDKLEKIGPVLKLMLDLVSDMSGAEPHAKIVFSCLSKIHQLLRTRGDFHNKLHGLIDAMASSIGLIQDMQSVALLPRLKEALAKLVSLVYDSVNFLAEYRDTSVPSQMLTLAFTSGRQDQLQKFVDQFQGFKEEFHSAIHAQNAAVLWKMNEQQEKMEREEILQWISPLDVKDKQHEVLKLRTENTGTWILQDAKFMKWRDSDAGGLLWCSGDAGTGKTTLSAVVIDHLLTIQCGAGAASMEVAWIYCDYNSSTPTVEQTLRCLLKQILERIPSLPDDVKTLFAEYKKGGFRSNPTLQEWKALWRSASVRKIYTVIDALDEYPKALHRPLLEALKPSTSSYLMITARGYVAVPDFPSLCRLRICAQEDDIRQYCIDGISGFTLALAVEEDAELHGKILSSVWKQSAGLFIVAKFLLASLKEEDTLEKLRSALKRLPNNIEDMYNDLIHRRIPDKDRKRAFQILSFVTHLRRPMAPKELQHLLAYDDGTVLANEGSLVDSQQILSVCKGAIVYDAATDTIRLVHNSAQEHFQNLDQFKGGRERLAQLCVKLFADMVSLRNSSSVDGLACSPDNLLFGAKDGHPILEYATENWGAHAKHSEVRVLQDLLGFLKNEYAWDIFLRCEAELYRTERFRHYNGFRYRYTGLHAAAWYGLQQCVQHLVDEGNDPCVADSSGATPLYDAAWNGHDPVVLLLLEKGADVNAQGGEYGTALQAASDWGHDSTVSLLLEKGADVHVQGGKYGTALQVASYHGHGYVVSLLLEKGADVNAHGGKYGTALQAASYWGHNSTVSLLLEKGADVNVQCGEYGTALQAASYRGRNFIVSLLLEKGADVNAQGGEYGTALQVASFWGHNSTVSLLLEMGADVNAQGGKYGTAFQAALCACHGSIVPLLLEKGADVNAQGGQYGTALQAASYRGHNSTISLLLEMGADVNVLGGEYGTALQAASHRGHNSTVSLLLEMGADVNVLGGAYGTALQAASYWGHNSTVSLLLEKGADVNAQGGEYGTALQAASYWGEDSTVSLLLEKGADVNAQGGEYGTALQAASREGHDSIVSLLLEKGADVNAQGGKYGSAFEAAFAPSWDDEKIRRSTVKILLKHGTDIDTRSVPPYRHSLKIAARSESSLVQLTTSEWDIDLAELITGMSDAWLSEESLLERRSATFKRSAS